MADLENFEFEPKIGFADSSAYPNPSNETAVREQLFRSHKQVQSFINDEMIPAINSKAGTLVAGANVKIITKDGVTIISATGGSESGGVTQEYVDYQDEYYYELSKQPLTKLETVTEVVIPKDDWIIDEETDLYYVKVTVDEAIEESCATVYPYNPYEKTREEIVKYNKQYSKLVKAITHEGYITFVATFPVTEDITVNVKGVGYDNEGRKHYSGSYTITPSTEDQEIDTDEKILDYDITVGKVPYTEEENEQDGITVTIGGE